MIRESDYRKAFIAALVMHLLLGMLLLTDSSSQRPVLTQESRNEPGQIKPLALSEKPEPEIVRAVSVNNQEVMATVNRLKEERAQQIKAEQSRQAALNRQAEQARKARVMEQQRLARLKDESEKLAIARKKQIEEEKKRLKELSLQKEQEKKNLQKLKAQQQQMEKKQKEDAARLAELNKAKEDAKLKEEQARLARESELAKEKQAQAARDEANREASRQARMAGEVNKYRAMILNAISQRWIVPENVDRTLSSQFHIRLAADGSVLEVSLIRSSGDSILDRSAQTAIYKASPLPVPGDPDMFASFRDINLTVRPENVRG